MFSSWTKLATGLVVCGFAIATSAVPFPVPRQAACDTNPHKIGVMWKGNIAGWLGSPNSAHPERIGLVHSADSAHTFQISGCSSDPYSQVNTLICTDCDPSANVIGGVAKTWATQPLMSNVTMVAGTAATATDHSGSSWASWSLDGTTYNIWHSSGQPFCWYDGTQSELSVSAVVSLQRQNPPVSSNCKFVAQ